MNVLLDLTKAFDDATDLSKLTTVWFVHNCTFWRVRSPVHFVIKIYNISLAFDFNWFSLSILKTKITRVMQIKNLSLCVSSIVAVYSE